jgi:cytochrome c oxidase subunit IV
MASATTEHYGDSPIDTSVLDAAEAPYPRNRLYVKIAIVLALLTVAEILVHSFPGLFGGSGSVGYVIALLITMFAKFWAVGYFFMHLKWDNKLLNRVFYFGFTLAVVVYVALMAMFNLFTRGIPT